MLIFQGRDNIIVTKCKICESHYHNENKMAANGDQGNDYKESFMKMANSAFNASKTGWTRAKQVLC